MAINRIPNIVTISVNNVIIVNNLLVLNFLKYLILSPHLLHFIKYFFDHD